MKQNTNTTLKGLAKELLEESHEVLKHFGDYAFQESQFFSRDEGFARPTSADGLLVAWVDQTKFTVLIKSHAPVTGSGSKFVQPLVDLLSSYYLGWDDCERWVKDFLSDPKKLYVGLTVGDRAIYFRKNMMGLWVDVEAVGIAPPKSSINNREKGIADTKD